MNKWLIGGLVALGIVVLGGILFVMNQPVSPPTTQTTTQQQTQTQTTPPTSTSSVVIEGGAFKLPSITVKKGTTVTWTNKDDTQHNVVSDSDAPAGGPPQEADLLSKGESFSFTYDTVGVFRYHCAPHPFMQGTVEVTE